MSDPSLALQDAVLFALRDDSGVAAKVAGRVYDRVPPGAAFPYISFGPMQTISDTPDCIGGSEIFMQLDVWSRKPGSVEAKEIADLVRTALHGADLTLNGHALVDLQFQDTRDNPDPDGLTRHAAMTFRALTDPEQGVT